jgi:hypothetical protein
MTYRRPGRTDDSPVLHSAIAMANESRARTIEVAAYQSQSWRPEARPYFRRCSGGAPDPLTQFRVAGNGRWIGGWCAMINYDGGYVTAFLDQDVGRENAPTSGGHRQLPHLDRRPVPGGYRVVDASFASGCRHCEWSVGCIVVETNAARHNKGGRRHANVS